MFCRLSSVGLYSTWMVCGMGCVDCVLSRACDGTYDIALTTDHWPCTASGQWSLVCTLHCSSYAYCRDAVWSTVPGIATKMKFDLSTVRYSTAL